MQRLYHNRLFTESLDDSDLLRQHSKLFKVDQSIHLCLVPIVEERQVLLEYREERNERGRGAALKFTVLGHVVKWVHEASQVIHCLAVLGGNLLPRGPLTLYQAVIQTTQNVKHGVEVLLLPTPFYKRERERERKRNY